MYSTYPAGTNTTAKQFWEKILRQTLVTDVYIDQSVAGIAHFVIDTVKPEGKTRNIYQGTLESLNNGSTVVRGEVIGGSVVAIAVIFVSLWCLYITFVTGYPQVLLIGIVVLSVSFIFHERAKQARLEYIKSILGSNE